MEKKQASTNYKLMDMAMPQTTRLLTLLSRAANLMQHSQRREAMAALKEGLTLVKSHADNATELHDMHIHLFWQTVVVWLEENNVSSHQQLYGKALSLTTMDDVKSWGNLSSISAPLEVLSTVFIYNMALCYHCQALASTNQLLHWNKALALYQSSIKLLDESRPPSSSIALLHLAIYHNMGRVHSFLEHHEEVAECTDKVRRILQHTEPNSVPDYDFFHHITPNISGEDQSTGTATSAASA
jgi:tetratricopeptide (TPR) repeat protein